MNLPATLPQNVIARGIDEAQWNTLCNSLFPGAKADSVLMVVDYCKARKLDPLKKPCHSTLNTHAAQVNFFRFICIFCLTV